MKPALLGKRYHDDGVSVLTLNETQLRARKEILAKVQSAAYTLENCVCGVCGAEGFDVLARKDRYGLPLSVVICQECGLVQSNPRMDQRSYAEFYDSEYRRLYVGAEGPTTDFFSAQVFQGKKIAEFFRTANPFDWQGRRVLEVGCGAGGILKHFRDLGAQVRGCDLGSEYLQYGRDNHGLELSQGPISTLPVNEVYDVIIYSHVFEHVSNPVEELLEVSKRLAPGGVLYLEVPGIHNIRNTYRSDFLRLLQNAHIFHFTLTSLTNLVGSHGFKMLYGTEYVQALYEFVPEYQRGISNDYSQVMNGLKRYEKIRPYNRYLPNNLIRVIRLNIRRALRRG